MILEVQERLALMEILPTEGDYASIKTLRRARETISITPDEAENLQFEQQGDGVLAWNPAVAATLVRDIPIDEWTTNTVCEILIKLSNEKKLKDVQLSLYEKFVKDFE